MHTIQGFVLQRFSRAQRVFKCIHRGWLQAKLQDDGESTKSRDLSKDNYHGLFFQIIDKHRSGLWKDNFLLVGRFVIFILSCGGCISFFIGPAEYLF